MTEKQNQKVALVTGANKGIGKETARQLATQGVTVWLGSRDERRGQEAEAELRAEGDVRHVALDVTDSTTVDAAAKLVEDQHGQLDILVNNAGIGVPDDFANPPSTTPVEAFRAIYEVNVYGVVRVTNAFLPLIRRSAAGRIVNLSSELGSLDLAAGPPHTVYGEPPMLLAYNSSKAALNMVTLTYARELRDTRIKINVVSPGYCATDLNDFQGHLAAAEGARVPVRAATLPDDGPSGTFIIATGTQPW